MMVDAFTVRVPAPGWKATALSLRAKPKKMVPYQHVWCIGQYKPDPRLGRQSNEGAGAF
jgi:hypothetical protein